MEAALGVVSSCTARSVHSCKAVSRPRLWVCRGIPCPLQTNGGGLWQQTLGIITVVIIATCLIFLTTNAHTGNDD